MTEKREEPNIEPSTGATQEGSESAESVSHTASGSASEHGAEYTHYEDVHHSASEHHDDATAAAASAAAAAAAAAASSGHSTYSPPPPPSAAARKSPISRLWGFPGVVLILVLLVIALFIWGITAHQESVQKKVVAPAQKVLHVTSAPSIAAITQAQHPMTATQTKLLMKARGAFWHHDYTGAIADYHDLIQQAPNSPAPYGELGNVLYMTGHYRQAAAAYGQAAMRLIHEGRYADGAALIPVLGRLDPAEAQKVQMALSHAPEAETGMPPA